MFIVGGSWGALSLGARGADSAARLDSAGRGDAGRGIVGRRGLFVDPLTALILLVFILVDQQVEGSVLRPMVYSRAVQLHPLLIFVAVLVGAALLGIPGALLAIPVAGIFRITGADLLAYRRMRQDQEETAVPSPSQPPIT